MIDNPEEIIEEVESDEEIKSEDEVIVSEDDESEIDEEISESDVETESQDEESEDEVIESEDEVIESDEDVVSVPLQFVHEGERYELQAVSLAADRASSTIDYTSYLESFQIGLFLLICCVLGVGISISFILGVKK